MIRRSETLGCDNEQPKPCEIRIPQFPAVDHLSCAIVTSKVHQTPRVLAGYAGIVRECVSPAVVTAVASAPALGEADEGPHGLWQ